MKRLEVETLLNELRQARSAWGKGRTEFFAGYDVVLRRLIMEGAANYMSDRDMAKALAVSPKTIRAKMRALGLDSRSKTVLSQQASEALAENAALMGIEPSEMDLTSPLAYLPMGSEMKQRLKDAQTSQVHEIEGVSRNAPITPEEAWTAFAEANDYEYPDDYDYSEQRRFWLMGYGAALDQA